MTRPNNPNNPRTQINVKRTTRNKLNDLRKYPGEYLDSVIMRLINKINKDELIGKI